jgi:hypothetical protein
VVLGIVENAAFGDEVHANLLSIWQRERLPSSRTWMQLDKFEGFLARGGNLNSIIISVHLRPSAVLFSSLGS